MNRRIDSSWLSVSPCFLCRPNDVIQNGWHDLGNLYKLSWVFPSRNNENILRKISNVAKLKFHIGSDYNASYQIATYSTDNDLGNSMGIAYRLSNRIHIYNGMCFLINNGLPKLSLIGHIETIYSTVCPTNQWLVCGSGQWYYFYNIVILQSYLILVHIPGNVLSRMKLTAAPTIMPFDKHIKRIRSTIILPVIWF